jgi:hypothetical protein
MPTIYLPGHWFQMDRWSLRHYNRFISRLEEDYRSIPRDISFNLREINCSRLFGLGNTGISTDHAQNLKGHCFQMDRLSLRHDRFNSRLEEDHRSISKDSSI